MKTELQGADARTKEAFDPRSQGPVVNAVYEGFSASTVKVVISEFHGFEVRPRMSRAEAELTVALARDVVGPRLRGGKAPEIASNRRLSKPRSLYSLRLALCD